MVGFYKTADLLVDINRSKLEYVVRIEEARVAKNIFGSAMEHPFNVAQFKIFLM
jgi:hypothetical protein